MEYISTEEFLKQPKNVQQVFLDWWKPSIGDLVKTDWEAIEVVRLIVVGKPRDSHGVILHKKNSIPLLTEGQLRKFIEDKTKGIVKVVQWNPCKDDNKYGYTIYILAKDRYKVLREFGYLKLGTDLLKAYWKVACEIAKENAHE